MLLNLIQPRQDSHNAYHLKSIELLRACEGGGDLAPEFGSVAGNPLHLLLTKRTLVKSLKSACEPWISCKQSDHNLLRGPNALHYPTAKDIDLAGRPHRYGISSTYMCEDDMQDLWRDFGGEVMG